jgi:hypothetical protein
MRLSYSHLGKIPLAVGTKERISMLVGFREGGLNPTSWAKFLGATKSQLHVLVFRAKESHSSLFPWK